MTPRPIPDIIDAVASLVAAAPKGALIPGACLGRWEEKEEGLTVADGEAGRGLYFFFKGDRAMFAHYQTAGGGRRTRYAEVTLAQESMILDLTHPKVVRKVCRLLTEYACACGSAAKWESSSFQRAYWGLTMVAGVLQAKRPEVVGYVVPHITPSVPASRQVVIFRGESGVSELAA